MINFSISKQIDKELAEFRNTRIKIVLPGQQDSTIRFAVPSDKTYYYNQAETIALIDLYYNSMFEKGPYDNQGQRKMFLNVGKFRTDVSAKQIDLDIKDLNFVPSDYADPWTATFMKRDFQEWAKDCYFGEVMNDCVENFPKYGTVVLKKVGNQLSFVPLQNLRNEQSAESLQSAAWIIEEHPDMYAWELQDMAQKGWDIEGINLRFDQTINVYERYGYVTLKWLKENSKGLGNVQAGDEMQYVDCQVIMGRVTEGNSKHDYILYAKKITTRPYREAHWSKQHGRWLGVGTMEDQFENQRAKNIVVNLIRRGLQWAAKRILQSASTDVVGKNLVQDVKDGEILEVGVNGDISTVDLSSRSNADYQQFMGEWEKNSDQKAFTYEVATGESMPSGTPFRLGVILSQATNSFFDLKREKLGLFFKHAISDFILPQFVADMSKEDRVLTLFSGESGFEVLKSAAMCWVRSEVARISLMSGKPVDVNLLNQITSQYDTAQALPWKLPKSQYKDAKVKFSFDPTGEELDLPKKIESLKSIWQAMVQAGDPRAEGVLKRLGELSGEDITQFGPAPQKQPQPVAAAPTPQPTNAVQSSGA